MLAGVKKFDIHSKSIEGVNQQTVLGALLTVVTAILVVVLLFSEVTSFLEIDVVSRMAVDQTVGLEAIKLEFDVTFQQLKCDRFDFVQEVTRGTIHVHEPIAVQKEAIGSNTGCHILGSLLTDKVTGNFRFGVQSRGRVNPESGEQEIDFNLSHTINNLVFLPTKGKLATDKLPEIPASIQRPLVTVPAGISIYQYSIQVVGTQYKTLYGELSFLNQYSINEKMVDTNPFARQELLSSMNAKDFNGIVFSYDFNPVSEFILFFTYFRCIMN